MAKADRAQRPEAPFAALRPYVQPVRIGWATKACLIGAVFLFCLFYGGAMAFFLPYFALPLAVPLVVLGLITILFLPETNHPPVRLLNGLFVAFVLATVLWPNYLAISLPNLPWITLVRLIDYPMVFVLLICLVTSSAVRRDLAATLGAAPWITRLVVALVAFEAFSIVVSTDRGASISKFLIAQTNWTAVFLISCLFCSRPGRSETFAGVLCVIAFVLALIGLDEQRLHAVPWVGHIPSFLRVNDPVVDRILAGQVRSGVHRVQTTYGVGLGLAEYIVLVMPFVIHFAIGAYRRRTRVAAILMIPLMLVLTLVAQARMAALGVLLCFLAYSLAWGVSRLQRVKGSLIGPTIVYGFPILFAAVIASTFIIPAIHFRVWGGGLEQYSTQGRYDQLHMGLPKIFHAPWGYGIGRGAITLGYYSPGGLLTIDSYYLRLALEYGIVGLFVYWGLIAAALAYCAAGALRNRATTGETSLYVPTGIALGTFAVVRTVFAQDDNQSIYFMLLGMLASVIRIEKAFDMRSLTTLSSRARAGASLSGSGARAGRGTPVEHADVV